MLYLHYKYGHSSFIITHNTKLQLFVSRRPPTSPQQMMAWALIHHKHLIPASSITIYLPPQSLASCVVSPVPCKNRWRCERGHSKGNPGECQQWIHDEFLDRLSCIVINSCIVWEDTTHDASDCGGRHVVIRDANIGYLWRIRVDAIICYGHRC